MFESYGRSVFKNRLALSFDYVPPKLVHREQQLKRLSTLFRPVVESNCSQTAFLYGLVGTGKTVTAKRFCLDLREYAQKMNKAIDFVVINCRQRNSEAAAMLHIINHFQPNFPDRGFSISEMIEILRKDLEKRKLHLMIVLDEADVLLRKSGSDIIYRFSRFAEEGMDGRQLISIMLISQRDIFNLLDPASLSTFKRSNMVEFGKYSVGELEDITRQRAEIALHDGAIDDDSIRLIADASAEFGDARFAIEILEKSGMLADEEHTDTITPEHIRGAKAEAVSSITESKLVSLDTHLKLVLLAIARSLRKQAYTTTGEAEKSYKIACEEFDEKPRAHTAFWGYLKDLDDFGLISAHKSGEGISGKTSIITIPDMPVKVLEEKLVQLIGDEDI
ncbi:MAG: AAA family ATPase [Thermoplasmata archaeon]|nr:AAA family ATPase [Thermoplasmata archaeon]